MPPGSDGGMRTASGIVRKSLCLLTLGRSHLHGRCSGHGERRHAARPGGMDRIPERRPGASPPPVSGACVHNEHSTLSTLTAQDASCVQVEHTADVRPMRPMSPHRLLVCLAVLGWSERELARRTGRHQTTIKRWTGGRCHRWRHRRLAGKACGVPCRASCPASRGRIAGLLLSPGLHRLVGGRA
jgi:hypothetical protein